MGICSAEAQNIKVGRFSYVYDGHSRYKKREFLSNVLKVHHWFMLMTYDNNVNYVNYVETVNVNYVNKEAI